MAEWKPDARILAMPFCGIVLLASCSLPVQPSPAVSKPLDPIEPVVPEALAVPPLPPTLVAATPVYCPRLDLPKERDATCAGKEEALDRLAVALQPHPLSGLGPRWTCDSPWYAEVVASHLRVGSEHDLLRDRRLARVEECAGIDAALVRLVRVWYSPDCADGLAEGALHGEHAIAPSLRVALHGYAIAAKLDRMHLLPPWDESLSGGAALQALRRRISPWLNALAETLRAVRPSVEALPRDSHGRAVAEVALASTRYRLLSARVQPHEAEWGNKRFYDAFYAVLHEIRDPLEEEDASHLGDALAAANTLADWTLLQRWNNEWAERGVGMVLRGLILPPLPEVSEHFTRDAVLAALLPPYVAARILPLDRIDSNVLWGLVVRGFDPVHRRWSAAREFGATDALLLAHARLALSARVLEPSHGVEALRLLRPHSRIENAELLGAVGAGLAQLPARDVRFAPDIVRDPPTAALDAIASRAGASPMARAIAARDAGGFAIIRDPEYASNLARQEAAYQLMLEAGPELSDCNKLGFFSAWQPCWCPTVRLQ